MKHGKLNLRVLVAVLTVTTGATLYGQARFQSKASGLWSAAATWQLVTGSSSTGIPGALDTADILSSNIVAIGTTTSDCATLIVEAGGTLQVNAANNLRINGNPGSVTVYGTITLSSSGTLQKQGTGTRSLVLASGGKMTLSGSAATPVFTSYSYDPSSTVEYTATANQTVLSGVQYGNLNLGGSGTKAVAPVPPDTVFRCAGTLNVASNVYFDVSTDILRIYFMGDVVNYGTIDASVGITVLYMTGKNWVNDGTYLPSYTPGFGYNPATVFDSTTVGGTSSSTFYDLIVRGTMTAGSNFTVQRHVTINPGAVFNAGSGLVHLVGGNWTNNGTFNCGTSTVNFDGTAGQTVGASTFYNVILNDSSGMTLGGNVVIGPGGMLTLTKGNITTGANTLSINASAGASLVLGANKITGNVTRSIGAGSTETYLFFDANTYVIPGGVDNPTSISASVHPRSNPPALPPVVDTNTVVKRYYTFTGSGTGPSFTFTLRLSYDTSEIRGNQAKYTMWENSGTGWVDQGSAGPPDTVLHFEQQAGLYGFSNWTLAESTSPLPIQLASFGAAPVSNSGGIRVTWRTVSEIGNYGFYVQRSASSAGPFVDLPNSFVAGHGTTLATNSYAWTDPNVPQGTYYYRLKQVDLNGSYRCSAPVKVVQSLATGINNGRQAAVFSLSQNYPNPFNPATRVRFSVDNSAYTTVRVFNILGVEVATLFEGMAVAGVEYTVVFDGNALANGAYFCRLTSGDKTSLRKMVLLK